VIAVIGLSKRSSMLPSPTIFLKIDY